MNGSELDNVAIALIASWLIQLGKMSKSQAMTWLSKERPRIIRTVGALVAALSAAGLTWSFDAGELHIGGLTVANLSIFVWVAVKQFAFQEMGFHVMFQGKE